MDLSSFAADRKSDPKIRRHDPLPVASTAMALTARKLDNQLAGPVLKWAGGKTQLLDRIIPRLGDRIRTYYEPFIGGGAVFFALANQGRFRDAVISDKNPALVELYTVLRDEVEALIEGLAEHGEHATDQEYFYDVRAWDTAALSPVERAARTVFLNKTCFNGLYRLNRKGEFNVPFGRYKNPRVLNAPLLRASSQALQGVTILDADFQHVAIHARRGDAVYFDPPYVPISATSSFASYAKEPFGPSDQERLVQVFETVWRRGATAVMSNSDCDYTRALYAGLEVETVHATRAINSVASKRGRITEVLCVGMKRADLRLAEPADSALPAARARLSVVPRASVG